MKYLNLIFIFLMVPHWGVSQKMVETVLMESHEMEADTLFSVDHFGAIYFSKNNVFYKKGVHKTISYSNLQLGDLYIANTFNPLKINLFYKDFNTLVVLDNRFAEIFKIDFNALSPYKNVSHIATGFDNTVWIFNQDQQKLELFDYKTQSTRAQTAPVQSKVLDLKSDYNHCWLLTQKHLYQFNYFGTLVNKMENTGYTSLQTFNGNCVLKKGNTLFYLNKNNKIPVEIKIPYLSLNGFFVTNETLYIYRDETLYKLQIKIN